jgi:coenzyme F420-reducing hydrogenase delta subunit/Pyruvate/2-oxoacid:ferredoxin oxidoreductase delta subunit
MKIVIAGRSPEKAYIEDTLRSEGIECIPASTPEEAKALSEGLPVILLGESVIDPFLEDGEFARRAVSKLGVREPVVFLLDRGRETPDHILTLVLRRAYSLASAKRPAYILLRSVRSGLPGIEKLYLDVRKLGVSVIKYEKVSTEFSDDGCNVIADDGVCRYDIHTPLLVDCAPEPDDQTMSYADALRIHTYGDNAINSDRWFIPPGRTSRRGVYYIDTGLVLSGTLRETLVSIADEIKKLSEALPGAHASIDTKKCAYCYTCFRVCTHGALVPDTGAPAMKVIETLCNGCGMCVAVCPAKAISLTGAEDDGIMQASPAETIVFCCENSAAIAAKSVFGETDAKITSMPCGGNIDTGRILSALRDHDRVIVAVCMDEACRHFDGSVRARKQVERVRHTVEKIGIDPQRICFVQLSHAMPAILKEAVDRSRLPDGGQYDRS